MAEQPEKKFSTGSVSATVWQNKGKSKTGEEVSFKTVSFQRRYTDKEGNWKTTSTLRTNDLPKAALVLSKAYEHLVLRDGSNNAELPAGDEGAFEEIVM